MIHPVRKRGLVTNSPEATIASTERARVIFAVALYRNMGYAVWPSYQPGFWKICDKTTGDTWEHSDADMVSSVAGVHHQPENTKEPVRLTLREIRAIREREGGLHV